MKLLKIIYKYIKYWFISQRIYTIQSPFLYELATQVIRKKTANKSIEEIQHLRNKLSRSEKVINITDYGAGSNINPSTKRKIKDIVINSSKNSKFGILLYNIVSFYKPNNIVELGTSFGISTLYLSKAFNSAKVYSFEGCPETIKIAEMAKIYENVYRAVNIGLVNELKNGRPIIYSGYRKDESSGHTFVVDGYKVEKGKTLFHFVILLKLIIATSTIYILGLIWLGTLIGWNKPIFALGAKPFLLAEIFKIMLLALLTKQIIKIKKFI